MNQFLLRLFSSTLILTLCALSLSARAQTTASIPPDLGPLSSCETIFLNGAQTWLTLQKYPTEQDSHHQNLSLFSTMILDSRQFSPQQFIQAQNHLTSSLDGFKQKALGTPLSDEEKVLQSFMTLVQQFLSCHPLARP